MRAEPDSGRALAAIAALRESGGRLRLLTESEPTLLLAGLDLHLRNAVAWESRRAASGWETVFRPAEETVPAGLVDALVQEHRQLDALLGRALRRLNAMDADGARPMLAEFAAGLRRHLRLEDEVLAAALGPDPAFEPLGQMLEEHRALASQLADLVAALGAEAWELEAYAALLSGTLAKHEHREESGVFPAWRARLGALPPEAREALERQAAAAL